MLVVVLHWTLIDWLVRVSCMFPNLNSYREYGESAPQGIVFVTFLQLARSSPAARYRTTCKTADARVLVTFCVSKSYAPVQVLVRGTSTNAGKSKSHHVVRGCVWCAKHDSGVEDRSVVKNIWRVTLSIVLVDTTSLKWKPTGAIDSDILCKIAAFTSMRRRNSVLVLVCRLVQVPYVYLI
jgi:hypothetical protein